MKLDHLSNDLQPVQITSLKLWQQPAVTGSYMTGHGRELLKQTTEIKNGNRVYEIPLVMVNLPDMVNLRDALAQAIEIEIEAGRDKGAA